VSRRNVRFLPPLHGPLLEKRTPCRRHVRKMGIEIAHLAADLAHAHRALAASERKCRALQRRVTVLEALLASTQAALAKAQQTIREDQHQLFGRHTERGAVPGSAQADVENAAEGAMADAGGGTPVEPHPAVAVPAPAKKKRGARRGHPGHGRRVLEQLPCTEHVLTLPAAQRRCPRCGKVYTEIPGAYAVSLLLDWVVSVFYRRYLRQKYRPACSCPGIKRILVAPPPAKVLRKGLLSPQCIARVGVEKFWLSTPAPRPAGPVAEHARRGGASRRRAMRPRPASRPGPRTGASAFVSLTTSTPPAVTSCPRPKRPPTKPCASTSPACAPPPRASCGIGPCPPGNGRCTR
jgi:hypothetical protein